MNIILMGCTIRYEIVFFFFASGLMSAWLTPPLVSRCPQINGYVGEWLSYQKLWDLNSDLIFGRLGDDIGAWMACAEEMK